MTSSACGVGLAVLDRFLLDLRVGVVDPVHGAVADGVGADRDAGLMEEADHLAVDFWVGVGVAVGAGVGGGGIAEPVVVDPAGAGAAGAVHVDLGAAGEQAAVAEAGGQTGGAVDLGEGFLCLCGGG